MARHDTAPPPRTRPAVGAVASLVAVLLIGVAVVAVHDLLAAQDWIGQGPWLDRAVDAVSGEHAEALTVTVGVVAVLLGLAFVVVALARGRRTHLRVDAPTEVWVSPQALAAVAARAADRSPGVLDAAVARASRRRVVLAVSTRRASGATSDDAAVLERARAAADQEAALVPGTKVVVRSGRGAA